MSLAYYRHWQTGFSEATSSWNHAWLGSVGSFLYHSVGGITCRDDGRLSACGAIDVRPYPPMLDSIGAVSAQNGILTASAAPMPFANVSYDSVRGLVECSWAYSYDIVSEDVCFNMTVTFPANIEAVVAVPVWIAGPASQKVVVAACSSECVNCLSALPTLPPRRLLCCARRCYRPNGRR